MQKARNPPLKEDLATRGGELVAAVCLGAAARVQEIMNAAGADDLPLLLEYRDANGYTPFLAACNGPCTRGRVDCLQALMKAGCNTSVKDNNGLTGLMLAVDAGGKERKTWLLQTLLDSGRVDLEVREEHGYTAFLQACDSGLVESMKALIAAGCITAAESNHGLTGLAATAMNGETAALQVLLDSGQDSVNLEARSGAFLVACYAGRLECMQVLIASGCDTAVKSSNGMTGLQLAKANGQPAAAEYLQRHACIEELMASGQYEKAKALLKRALVLNPGSTEIVATMGIVEKQAKQALEVAAQKAKAAEAELLAILDAEAHLSAKKEKRRQKAQSGAELQAQREAQGEPKGQAGDCQGAQEVQARGSTGAKKKKSRKPKPLCPITECPPSLCA